MKKILLFGIVFLFLVSFVYAEDSKFVLKINQEYDLKIPCITSNYSMCDETTVCLLNINYPDYSNMVKNQTMSYNYNYYNYTISQGDLNQLGNYYTFINCLGAENGFIEFFFEVNPSGTKNKDNGASIGIIIFILIINITLFILGFKEKILKNQFTNLILKRSLILISIFLMMFNLSIVVSVAQSSGIPLTKELFMYMEIFGWAGYVGMIILSFSTVVEFSKMLKAKKTNERMGFDEDG